MSQKRAGGRSSAPPSVRRRIARWGPVSGRRVVAGRRAIAGGRPISGRWPVSRPGIRRCSRRRRKPRDAIAMRHHALGIHDIVLLLQRHLRVGRVAGAHYRSETRTGSGADPGAAAAANRPTDRRTESGGEQRGADRLRCWPPPRRGRFAMRRIADRNSGRRQRRRTTCPALGQPGWSGRAAVPRKPPGWSRAPGHRRRADRYVSFVHVLFFLTQRDLAAAAQLRSSEKKFPSTTPARRELCAAAANLIGQIGGVPVP